jgi:hypothetical protein
VGAPKKRDERCVVRDDEMFFSGVGVVGHRQRDFGCSNDLFVVNGELVVLIR